jgi:integrase
MSPVKLSSVHVKEMPFAEAGQKIVFDSEVPGFGVRITGSKKSYIAQARVAGRTVRVTLGPHTTLTCEAARKAAKVALGKMAGGSNVNAAKQEDRAKSITLDTAIKAFFKGRTLKASTAKNYTSVLQSNFGDWYEKQLRDITPALMLKRFNSISDRDRPALANLSARIFRSVWNFNRAATALADGTHTLPACPVSRVSETRSWNKVQRRQGYITGDMMPAWFAAVRGLTSDRHPAHAEAFRDYLELTIRTGMRRSEGMSLQWSSVNLKARTFTIQETKNGRPLSLPMSDQIHEIFKRRAETSEGDFVFSGAGETGRMVDPRKFHDALRVKLNSGWILHDLRRSTAVVAESLDLSGYAIRRLLNHTDDDVTSGYIIHDPERLRVPMQRISDEIDRLAKLTPDTVQADQAEEIGMRLAPEIGEDAVAA